MTTANLVAILLVLLLLTVVSQPLSRWLRMPYSSTLVLVGFAASELAVGLGVDTGIRAGGFHDLIFFVFLPILVFEAAFCIDTRLLRQNLLPVLFLATVIMLASALLTGVLAVWLMRVFQERWLAMLIAIAAVLVARLVSVCAGLWLLRPLLKPPIDKTWPPVIVWTGLRGSVALALALSLPVEFEYWWTIQSIAFGVVLFSVFVQAPTARLLIR
jgi:NhaP-type Na+/H+ or K+/H+ antiporter